MAYIPFIGRLNPAEYIALVGSFVLVGLEAIIRILTLAMPSTVISLFYRASRRLFNRFTSPSTKKAEKRKNSEAASIRNASDFVDICDLFGYYVEEHVVRTGDGYLLGLHRLAYKKGEQGEKVNSGPNSVRKPVVYMHHGLLMNSEVWVCLTEEQRCLPFKLVEKGYDVWLGNSRGNKYSKKSVNHSPTENSFWNFSMDDFAFYDIPDSINYILSTTAAPSLSYIGFSQGTAQAFATLAVHPKLNDQINVFIALAPAMSPAGLSNGIVDALVKASPQVLFLMFGRRSILSSATMWQSILYPPIFVRVIDMGLSFLFGWKAHNIPASQKLAAYPHLYSFTSTKSVVHWFQIIRNKSFQMYDDDVQPVVGSGSKYTKVAKFPTRNIKTPIVLVYGGSDSLVDINVMLKELPSHTIATEVPHYEHLDFLWARGVDTLVFPHVFDALESFSDAEHTKEEYARYRTAHHASLGAMSRPSILPLGYTSDDESSNQTAVDKENSTYAAIASATPGRDADLVIANTPDQIRRRAQFQIDPFDDSSENSSPNPVSNPPHVRTLRPAPGEHQYDGAHAPAINGVTANSKAVKTTRSGSTASTLSFEGSKGTKGSGGINIGAARALGGVVARGVEGVGNISTPAGGASSDDGGAGAGGVVGGGGIKKGGKKGRR